MLFFGDYKIKKEDIIFFVLLFIFVFSIFFNNYFNRYIFNQLKAKNDYLNREIKKTIDAKKWYRDFTKNDKIKLLILVIFSLVLMIIIYYLNQIIDQKKAR